MQQSNGLHYLDHRFLLSPPVGSARDTQKLRRAPSCSCFRHLLIFNGYSEIAATQEMMGIHCKMLVSTGCLISWFSLFYCVRDRDSPHDSISYLFFQTVELEQSERVSIWVNNLKLVRAMIFLSVFNNFRAAPWLFRLKQRTVFFYTLLLKNLQLLII